MGSRSRAAVDRLAREVADLARTIQGGEHPGCPDCADWKEGDVLVAARIGFDDPEPPIADAANPCPSCGRPPPDVVPVLEVIVATREQVAAERAREAA